MAQMSDSWEYGRLQLKGVSCCYLAAIVVTK